VEVSQHLNNVSVLVQHYTASDDLALQFLLINNPPCVRPATFSYVSTVRKDSPDNGHIGTTGNAI